MGIFRRAWSALRGAPMTFTETPPRPIAELLLSMNNAGLLPRAGRAEALSVAPVLRSRNLICSTATLPLVQYRADWTIERFPLLEQIDPDVANVVTLAQTTEDLLFEGISWWRITAWDADNYPVYARHLDYSSVSLQPPGPHSPAYLPGGYDPRDAAIWYDGEPIAANPRLTSYASRPLPLVADQILFCRSAGSGLAGKEVLGDGGAGELLTH